MTRLFANPHLITFTVNTGDSLLEELGSSSLRVNNEVIDNTSLLDSWKSKALGPGEWSIDVEVAMDSTADTDLVDLAANKTPLDILIECEDENNVAVWTASGTAAVSSAENVIDGAIRQRGTLEGLSDLTYTLGEA